MKDKHNKFGFGKILLVVLAIIASIVAMIFIVKNNHTPKEEVNSPSDAIQEVTSRDDILYINYDNNSKIKSGSYVEEKDVIKYQASYVNSNSKEVNAVVTVNLSKGLDYVTKSSSVGEPTINKNDDGSSNLVFKRTLLGGVKEKLNFSCSINKLADQKVSVFLEYSSNNKQSKTSELINETKNYMVRYKIGSYGKATGDSFEKVKYGDVLNGVEIKSNEGYKIEGFVCDEDVLLKNGEKIKKGSLISQEALKNIKVVKDMTLTVKYKSVIEQYTIVYMVRNKTNQSQKVAGGDKIVIKKVTLNNGCEVKKWRANNNVYKSGDEITVKSDLNLIAEANCLSKTSKNGSSNADPISDKTNKVSKNRYITKAESNARTKVIIIGSILVILPLLTLIFIVKRKNK